MKPCLMDSGFLYALIDRSDRHSPEVTAAAEAVFEEVILPVPAITEVAHFVSKNLGFTALAEFVGGLKEMKLTIQAPAPEDYLRASMIIRKYGDANIDFVDACIVAMAERLGVTKILTADRRHFSIFRPNHCAAFELIPEG